MEMQFTLLPSIAPRMALFGRTLRNAMFGNQAGQRWLFRRNRGWLGGDRFTDGFVLSTCCAFVLMGFMFVARQESPALSIDSPSRWPTISARIVSVKMDEIRSERGVQWIPQVVYNYRVGGRQYQSSRVSLSPLRCTSRTETNAFLARYVSRTETPVHYNPIHPGESYLEEVRPLIETATFIGVLMIGVGVVTMIIYSRLR